MHDTLQEHLFAKWPQLYRLRHARPTRMSSFDHGDGWWSIVDALSEVVTSLALEAGQPVPAAFWSKEKFGNLRWSLATMPEDEALAKAMLGAVDMAEQASSTTCEQSGEPGCLWSLGGWYTTCSQAVAARWVRDNPAEVAACHLHNMDNAQPSSRLYVKTNAFDHSVANFCELAERNFPGGERLADVPVGFYDVALGLLGTLSYNKWGGVIPLGVASLAWNETAGFIVEMTGDIPPNNRGAILMASALARRIDRHTGCFGIPRFDVDIS